MCPTEDQIIIFIIINKEFLSTIKKNELVPFARKYIKLETIILISTEMQIYIFIHLSFLDFYGDT